MNHRALNTLGCALLSLGLAACGGPNNDEAAKSDEAAARKSRTHALSGYKRQLDKARAVEAQVMKHDQQRRKALQEMEDGTGKPSKADTE